MRWSVLLALAACGGGQTVVHYAPPMPRPVTQMPVVQEPKLEPVRRPDPLLLSIDRSLVSVAPAPIEPAAKSSKDVVREGREASLVAPSDQGGKCGMIGDQLVCRYEVGRTYEVYTCAGEQTRIELAPGERVLSDFHFGPNRMLARSANQSGQSQEKSVATFWNLSDPETTGDGRGHMVTQYFVLPANDRTLHESYLQLGTLVGPYRLKLVVLPQGNPACITAVRWRHPDLELQRLMVEQRRKERAELDNEDDASDSAKLRDVTCVGADYKFWVAKGNPRWTPVRVYQGCIGDRAEVTVELPRDVAWTKAPVIATDGGVAACRLISHDGKHAYVCDNLFSQAMMYMGERTTSEEVVYIQRLQEPK